MNDQKDSQNNQILTFQIHSERYGVAIKSVREINQFVEITPVPKAPDYIKGVMNLRGKIIPVISLRSKFGMPECDKTRDTCIIVIETAQGLIGAVVDRIYEVLNLGDHQIEPLTPFLAGPDSGFLKGIGKDENGVIILVDLSEPSVPEGLFEK